MKKKYVDIESGRPVTIEQVEDDDEMKMILCIGCKDGEGEEECFVVTEVDEGDYGGADQGDVRGEMDE